jgi:hypothetical protein
MGALLCLLLSFGSGGCTPRTTGQIVHATPAFASLDSLSPHVLKLEEAVLVLGGTKIPVAIESRAKEGECEITLSAYEQVMETEKYVYDSKSFKMSEITGETYDPPLDLLRFPLAIGDTYRWKGNLLLGEMSRPAEAEIATSSDKLFLAEKDLEAVKVSVRLLLESGGPQPAEHFLVRSRSGLDQTGVWRRLL